MSKSDLRLPVDMHLRCSVNVHGTTVAKDWLFNFEKGGRQCFSPEPNVFFSYETKSDFVLIWGRGGGVNNLLSLVFFLVCLFLFWLGCFSLYLKFVCFLFFFAFLPQYSVKNCNVRLYISLHLSCKFTFSIEFFF